MCERGEWRKQLRDFNTILSLQSPLGSGNIPRHFRPNGKVLRVNFPDDGEASDIVKAKSYGEDPRATGGLVSNLPHPRVNTTKQHGNPTRHTHETRLLGSTWNEYRSGSADPTALLSTAR